MLGRFDILQPTSTVEASTWQAERDGDAVFYAGGTELLILMKERLLEPALLIDLKTIPGLDAIVIEPDGTRLRIGALTTHRAIERSPLVRERLPVLAALAASVANVRVRHAGTLGGNLCFAEPHSDPATLLIALDATLWLASAGGEREVAAEDFFVGFMATARRPDEVLTDVRIPLPAAETGVAYERFKTHERPSASVAAAVTLRDGLIADARLVVGSIGERPVRIAVAEGLLRGEPPSPALFERAAAAVRDGVEPTVDVFESVDYKRHLAAVLTRRALAGAVAAAGAGVDGGFDGR